MYDKIISLVPESNKEDFLNHISLPHILVFYNRETTKKYPELFKIIIRKYIEKIPNDIWEVDRRAVFEMMDYIFENTNERKNSREFK